MRLSKSMSAAMAVAALAAIAGCDTSTAKDGVGEGRKVGGIAAKLTLPDSSHVDTVAFSITGPAGYTKAGNVPTNNSTQLTFRIGGIPVQSGYNIKVDADTNLGTHCTGNSNFDILNNQTTLVSLIIVCGATDNVGDIIVNGAFQSCPVVTAITAIPAEITLGNFIQLQSTISQGTNPVMWTGAGGTFGTPSNYDTSYTCTVAGPHTLTVAINAAGCTDARTVDVTCTLGAGCGNGQLDPGEQCDDGNTVNTDACTNTCQTAVCGDGVVQAGVETCDDSNNVTETCAYGVQSCTVCNSTCQSVPGATSACGNSIIDPTETCDDGNAVTETCAYGLASCSVCNASCQTAAGTTSRCGDGIVDAANGETCEVGVGGATAATCDATCHSVVVIDNCTPCRNTNCQNYQGINWVAGCFDSTAAGATARNAAGVTFTPTEVQACVDAIGCAAVQHCGQALGSIANDCYCGPFSTGFALDDCIASGPQGGDHPCSAAWRAVTEQTSPAQVLGAISDVSVPAGWAYFLLECQATFCSTVCPN